MEILIVALIGFAGGAAHLLTLAWRARQVAERPQVSAMSAPLGLLGPVLATVLVLGWLPAVAWALLPGLLLARLLLTGPLGRRIDPGAP